MAYYKEFSELSTYFENVLEQTPIPLLLQAFQRRVLLPSPRHIRSPYIS